MINKEISLETFLRKELTTLVTSGKIKMTSVVIM